MATAIEATTEDFKPQKKEVEILKVLAEKVKGHVKWYSVSKCYGFISRNDDGGDLFVHRSVISSFSKRFPSLRNGEEVEFSVVETNQGIEATYVTGPGGQPVKGMRPIYRRYRTTSDPNDNGDQDDSEHIDRRPVRGPRRRGPGRMRSTGFNESFREDNDHQDDDAHEREDKTHAKDSGAEGESPNHAVPRQRRRPPRRMPRNRSAPAESDVSVNHDGELMGAPAYRGGGGDGRGQMRRLRRPFHQRGGSRYMYNGWNQYDGYVMNGYHPITGYRQMPDRNGFDPRPRRRPFGGGYPRGPRHRPRQSEDTNPPVNGQSHLCENPDEDQNDTETAPEHMSEQDLIPDLETKVEQIKVEDCDDSSSENSDEPNAVVA